MGHPRFITAIMTIALLSACKHLRPAPPVIVTPPMELPAAEESTIDVPFSVPLDLLARELNGAVPNEIYAKVGQPKDCDEFFVYRRGAGAYKDIVSAVMEKTPLKDPPARVDASQIEPIVLSGSGDVLKTGIPLWYKLKVHLSPYYLCWPSASCGYGGEPLRKADINVSSTLAWDPAFRVHSTSSATAEMLDACNITIVQIDIRDKVRDAANRFLPKFATSLDRSVSDRTFVRPQAQALWDVLNGPIQIGEALWLAVRPVAFAASSPNVTGHTIQASLQLRARPALHVSAEAPPSATSPVPDLESVRPGAGFHLAFDVHAPYAELAQIANDAFKGKVLTYAGSKTTITKVDVYGSGSSVVLQVFVSGDVDGYVFAVGTPQLVNETVVVPDLDFSAETKQALARLALWILDGHIERSLREWARFPLRPKLDEIRQNADAAINKRIGVVQVAGKFSAFRPVEAVAVSPAGIAARIIADGSVEVRVVGKGIADAPPAGQ